MWRDNRKAEFDELRGQIDKFDSEIIKLVWQRMQISERIGEIKSEHNMPIHVPERERQVMVTRQDLGAKYGLRPKFVKALFRVVMFESRNTQKVLLKA